MTALPQRKSRVGFSHFLAVLYVGGWLALACYGVGLWRMYCEGFGCMGIGIAWLAWSAGYVMLLAVGCWAYRAQAANTKRFLRYVLIGQAAAGAVLVGYWAVYAAA